MLTEVTLNIAMGSDWQVNPAYAVMSFITEAGMLFCDIGYHCQTT